MKDEEKLNQSYLHGYSLSSESQANKVYPESKNPKEKYLSEWLDSSVYQEEILPDLRKLAGYEDYQEDESYTFPPDGNAEHLLKDLEEAFSMGIEDGLLDRPKLQTIDDR